MKFRSIALASILLFGCHTITVTQSPDSGNKPPKQPTQPAPPSSSSGFSLNFGNSPVPLGNIKAQCATNVQYGSHKRNVFDIWLPESSEPTPLVIFVHGGGFTSGDKSKAYGRDLAIGISPKQIKFLLRNKVAFASINYRLLENEETEGVIKSLGDIKYALQYMRHHAADMNIDAERVGLVGSSGGAGSSLWIGFSDDMADPNNSDPVLRESTRVQACAALATQSTYDLMRWETDVFPNNMFSMEQIKNTPLEERLVKFYGINSYAQLESDRIKKYRKDVDMLAEITSDDPPVYIYNKREYAITKEPKKAVSDLLHSPYHTVALRKGMDEVGVRHEIFLKAEGNNPKEGQMPVDFLLRELKN